MAPFKLKTLCIWALFVVALQPAIGQQVPDTTYRPVISHSTYSSGNGSVIFIDEGHHNFHIREGRYAPFANFLHRDGYVVKSYEGEFEVNHLSECKILVISNALNEVNVDRWILPNPSAFTQVEIDVLKMWVMSGGSLFLIADHMPLAGAAEELGAAFGFTFTNGFVMYKGGNIPSMFNQKDSTLIESVITRGRNETETVDEVATFTGQAFRIPSEATPILVFADDHINLLPDTAWQFNDHTRRQSVKGWSQGAFMTYGKGRLVVFGEAAMFSAQLQMPQGFKMGMNSNLAIQNHQLLLNIIHWLDNRLN